MRVISVVNTKGGTGKTTVAVNVAAALAGRGYRVLLVDTDVPQGSSVAFCVVRESVGKERPECRRVPDFARFLLASRTLHKDIIKYSNFDFIVIDAGAGDNAVVKSAILAAKHGMLVVPVQLSPFDVWGAEDTLRLLAEARSVYGDSKSIDAILFVNRRSTNVFLLRRQQDMEGTIGELCKQYKVDVAGCCFCDRAAFRDAVMQGVSVTEYATGKKSVSADKASRELQCFVDEILTRFDMDGGSDGL